MIIAQIVRFSNLSLFLISLNSLLISQNLVPNHSFEEFNGCPGDVIADPFLSNIQKCKIWYNPTEASPDYDNACSDHGVYGIPHNYGGKQMPSSGNAYFGLAVYTPIDRQEYIGVRLKEKLKKGTKYVFSIKVSLSDKADYCLDQFHYVLTDKKIKTRNVLPLTHPGYQIASNGSFAEDKDEWITLTGTYPAAGGEEYLTIGLFNMKVPLKYLGKNKKIKNDISKAEVDAIYYYVDDVSLTELKEEKTQVAEAKKEVSTEVATLEPKTDYHDKKYTLKNINFSVNSFQLPASNNEELDKLASVLNDDQSLKILVMGHTDNVGKETDNQELSQKRAEAIKGYLTGKGVSSDRITPKGLGSLSPIANNDQEDGRAQNRRVEIHFQ